MTELNGDGDPAMDGRIKPYIRTIVTVIKRTKAGLYQIQTADGKLFTVPKRNLTSPPEDV